MAEPKFEKDLERLEQIVEALETGGLSLDDSLKKFEEGIRLARRCEKTLSDAERRIELLTKNADGELATEPFAEADIEGDNGNGIKNPAAAEPRKPAPAPETADDEDEDEDKGLLF